MPIKHFLITASAILFVINLSANEEGKNLFRNNCAACHSIGKGRLVGPDMKDVHTKRPEEWLLKWTKSSSSLINAGDPDALKGEYAKKRKFKLISEKSCTEILCAGLTLVEKYDHRIKKPYYLI